MEKSSGDGLGALCASYNHIPSWLNAHRRLTAEMPHPQSLVLGSRLLGPPLPSLLPSDFALRLLLPSCGDPAARRLLRKKHEVLKMLL